MAELNLYQKLAKIRKSVEVVQKNKSGYGYKYVTDDELLARITVGMDKYGVSLIPGIVSESSYVTPYTYKKTKREKRNGTVETFEENVNEIIVRADMTFTWVNNENPEESIVVPWFMVGQQSDASQAFGSGLTYSNRYFLLKYFDVATPDDDPDNWRSKQKATELEEDRAVAAQIVELIDSGVKNFLTANPKAAEDVKKFMSKYVKGGNYFNITESAVAEKLLNDFKANFIKE